MALVEEPPGIKGPHVVHIVHVHVVHVHPGSACSR